MGQDLFEGLSVTEQSPPVRASDDEGYGLYVIYDPTHHLAYVKETDWPKLLAPAYSSPFYMLEKIASAPKCVSKIADLSAVTTNLGLRVGDSLQKVTRLYGTGSTMSCRGQLSYAFSRRTTPTMGASIGDPLSVVTLKLTGRSSQSTVSAIQFEP